MYSPSSFASARLNAAYGHLPYFHDSTFSESVAIGRPFCRDVTKVSNILSFMRGGETAEDYLKHPAVPFYNPWFEKKPAVIVASCRDKNQSVDLIPGSKLQNTVPPPAYIPGNERFSIQSLLGLRQSTNQSIPIVNSSLHQPEEISTHVSNTQVRTGTIFRSVEKAEIIKPQPTTHSNQATTVDIFLLPNKQAKAKYDLPYSRAKYEKSDKGMKTRAKYYLSDKSKKARAGARAKYEASDKGKAARARARANYEASGKGKKAKAKYEASGKGKKARAKYETSEKGKQTRARYEASKKGKQTRAKYEASEKGKQPRAKGIIPNNRDKAQNRIAMICDPIAQWTE